jgi:tricorn protease interacting factor F2/3
MNDIESYNLNFRFRFNELKYDCEEVVIGKFIGQIEFDADNLAINAVKMNGRDVPFTIKDRKLVVGPAEGREIMINFSGSVSETSLMGIHESKYESGHIITTQMEPTGARSVFPCVDEPSAKAKFRVEVNVDDEVEVIFNTRHLERVTGNGRSHFVFEETPPMSTYLIYIGIGRFDLITKRKKDRTLYVAAAPKKAKEGKFSLNLLSKLFTKYESYYKIKYPLSKMHLIAVPQFGAGAMENWGAITFRETAVLVNKSVSFRDKKEIAYTVSHEFAHQWFGDLVTMKWWDDLWLNESFATFVGFKILAKIHKDWNLWEDFMRHETLPSMTKDSLLTTHPIRVEVKSPDEIAEIFDQISYGKGASVLRMTEQFIGEGKFREGVYRYLDAHKYSNASGEDLWTSLSGASKKDVNSFMKSWLEKGGFPLVKIRKEDGRLIIRQQRFSYLTNNDDYLWQIPIFLENGKKRRKLLLKKREIKVKNSDGFLVNPSGEGYYRLLFDDASLEGILSSKGSPEFVMKLVDDYYAFLLSGEVDLLRFTSIIDRLRERNEYSIVLRITGILSELNNILDSEKLISIAVSYMREKFEVFKNTEDENSKVVLQAIMRGLAQIDKEFRDAEKVKLLDYSAIPPEERDAVLISSCMEGFEKERIWGMLKNPENDTELVRLMRAMSHFPLNNEVTEFLDYVNSRTELRANSIYSMFEAIYNKNYRKDLWKWTSFNLQKVRQVFGGTSTVSFYVEELISLAGIGNKNEVEEFVSNAKIPEAARAIKNGLEKLEVNERLVERAGIRK